MCLLPVARRKFGLDSEEAVSIVLEEDGTSVDEEDYFQDGLGPSNVLENARITKYPIRSDPSRSCIVRSVFRTRTSSEAGEVNR